MIEVGPIGVAHAASIARLASRPDVVAFGEHEPEQPSSAWVSWLGPPEPHLGMALGAWDEGRLLGVARLSLASARRQLHVADLHLLISAEPEGDAPLDALLGALTDACDRWLQVLRVVVRCPAGHRRVEGLFAEHGFRPEATLVGSIRAGGVLADQVLLARLREDVPVPERLSMNLRVSVERPPERVRPRVRAARYGDGPKLAATLGEPSVVWGTLQLPFQRPERWEAQLAARNDRFVLLVAELEGRVLGAGALTLAREPRRAHVATLGMHVATSVQGRGVGGALMRGLLETATARRVTRVQLTVYPDNDRAVRLYERAGFAHEGRSRSSSYRDGAYVDDLVMARVTRDG